MFWDSSGNTTEDVEILPSKLVMHQMDENRVFVKRIMRSRAVLGMPSYASNGCESQHSSKICVKWMIVFS